MTNPLQGSLEEGPEKEYTKYEKKVNEFLEQQRLRYYINSANTYVPRSIFKVNDDTDQSWFLQPRLQYLKDILNKGSNLVLMGGAGSGKSFELLQLLLGFKDTTADHVPFFVRMNSFQGGDLKNHLPEELELVPEKKCLLLLDGLDEVPQPLFEKAISAINFFTLSHPSITIIVSCRTNVLAIDKSGSNNRLTNFLYYTISDLQVDQIEQFSNITLRDRTSEFLKQVQTYHFQDLACKPFFLIILVETFNSEGNLSSGRSEIMLRFVKKSISQDTIRYTQENDKAILQKDVIRLLQRCALVMECAGRNFLTDAELQAIVKTKTKYQYVQYFSLFRKHLTTDGFHWMYEHNNIQEFLAARSLHNRPFEEIKTFLSSTEKKDFIKPTWLNTLSFLLSLVDDDLKKALLDWMKEVNPESMVKMERERVDEDTRLFVLKFIFEEYKLKNIWLFSSYFNVSELAQFSASNEAFNYLYDELTDVKATQYSRINALSIIREFAALNMEQRVRLEPATVQLLIDYQQFPDIIHHILASVVKIGLHIGTFPARIMELLKDRRNAYVRSGLYRIILATETTNEQVDYILEGVKIVLSQDKTDRDDIPLLDEAMLFDQLFQQFDNLETLKKEIVFFREYPQALHSLVFQNISEVLTTIVKNGIQLYSSDNDLYEVFAAFTKDVCSSTKEELITILIHFFRKTSTDDRLFTELWNDHVVKPYVRTLLLASVIDTSITKNFIDEYHSGNKVKSDVVELLHILDRNSFFGDGLPQKELFIQQIEQGTGIALPPKQIVDYSKAVALKRQQDFLLLFNQSAFVDKIKEVYTKVGKDPLNWEDIRNDTPLGSYLGPNSAPTPIIRFINLGTNQNAKLYLEDAINLASNRNIYEQFAIEEIYEHLRNQRIELTDEQKEIIANWCLVHGQLLTIEQGQLYYNSNPINPYTKSKPRMIWFFHMHLQIELPVSLLLTFTVFPSFSEEEGKDIFAILEKNISTAKLQERVLKNIKQRISHDYSRNQNYYYCFKHGLYEIFQFLEHDLLDVKIDYHNRIDLFTNYIKFQRPERFAIELLYHLEHSDLLFTEVVPEAFKDDEKLTIEWLRLGLDNKELNDEINTQIIFQLVNLDQLEGVKALTRKILNNIGNTDLLHLTCLRSIKNPSSIPCLIELLEHSENEQTTKRQLYGLNQYALEGLHSIALSGDNAFELVVDALTQYVSRGSERDFIHLNIKNWEYQRDNARSKNVSLPAVIDLIDPKAPLTELEFIKLVNSKRDKENKEYRRKKLNNKRLGLVGMALIVGVIKAIHELIPYLKNTHWVNACLIGLELISAIFITGLATFQFNPSAYHKYMESLTVPEHLKPLSEEIED
jgi:hypothetical protein